jgi:hypothetical protein
MSPRDNFHRYSVAQLEAMPGTMPPRRLDPPLDYLLEEVKLEDPPYRYSLVKDTRKPPVVRTRVIYRELIDERWEVVPIYSLSYLIDPMERAAIEANERGDRVTALLLLHGLLEILMRSDPVANYGQGDRFVDVAKEFSRRLADRALPGVDSDALKAGLLAVNEKRNDVIHSLLIRYGLEGTNAKLSHADFEAWKRTYDATLESVMEFVSL